MIVSKVGDKVSFRGEIKTIADFFYVGMNRKIQDLIEEPPGVAINLGAGNIKVIEDSIPYDLPGWDANTDEIPHEDASVAVVHCHHLLEHINYIEFLIGEIDRVLKPGGVAYITVPAYPSELAFEDPTHVRFFTLESMKNLLDNQYYTRNNHGLRVAFSLLVGVTGRNLCVLYQLEKMK